MTTETLEGTIKEVFCHNDNFAAVRIQSKAGPKRAAGKIIDPVPGQMVVFQGIWTKHDKWGKQFKVISSEIIPPKSEEDVLNYLLSGFLKGIGPAIAKRTYEHFGNETLAVLEENPERLTEISGITKAKVAGIVQSYQESKKYISLTGFLGQAATRHQIEMIYSEYQERSVAVLKDNPYRMVSDIDGVGFGTADKLALGCGITGNNPKRVNAAIVYVLQQISTDGHCFLHEGSLQENLREILKMRVDPEIFRTELENLIRCGRLVKDGDDIYLESVYLRECEAACHITRILEACPERTIPKLWVHDAIAAVEAEHNIKFEAEQREAVQMYAEHNILLITGGPGTGKTTIITAILRAWNDKNSVLLMAPVGRASRRMAEVTGYPAYTIHKALDYKFIDGKMGFVYNERNPLPHKLIIVDEGTLLDINLAAALFGAVRSGARLIILGDVDQLPSIGPGLVFQDLLNSNKVPKVRLKAGHRQSGVIDTNARRINQGMETRNLILNEPESFDFIPVKTTEEMQAEAVEQYVQLAHHYGVANVLCLAGVKKNSKVSTAELNRLIREQINPPAGRAGLKYGDQIYYVGDRVMQQFNNYEMSVFNGDLGTVVSINTVEQSMEVILDAGERVCYEHDDLRGLKLSYSCTIHKAMGSQFTAAVIVHSLPPKLWARNLVYTAVTRPIAQLVLIGDRHSIDSAIATVAPNLRNTKLKMRVQMDRAELLKCWERIQQQKAWMEKSALLQKQFDSPSE